MFKVGREHVSALMCWTTALRNKEYQPLDTQTILVWDQLIISFAVLMGLCDSRSIC